MDSAREIENLLYLYAERIDDGDLDGVAALFAHGRVVRGDEPPAEGSDAVRRIYQTRLYADGTPRTKHVTTNAIIEVDEGAGTATCRSYYTVFQQTAALPLQAIITGRYHDTFRVHDGRWWFDTRTFQVDQVGDVSQHLDEARSLGLTRCMVEKG
ncbi:nuclear transport factor 2 family protein [Nocardioides sp. Soil796]|uniref:nuclear transport factor 2 family protein n=1 Tax=Nocardioides sp. Soil796 TaxID=1736412 RepID=UPI00070A0CCC|nr:nuclear transport factor 2 family protein [Nocardioides sp. Soil796]KRF10472.1 hypothetical protein ASH02_20435 [Nocardioides sp. Soil796]